MKLYKKPAFILPSLSPNMREYMREKLLPIQNGTEWARAELLYLFSVKSVSTRAGHLWYFWIFQL